uniref:protein SCAF11 isoform X2 n=1 Tax=Pristiophorus japonicus TaxID=55135 RepID=UPI00398E69FF
MGGRKLTEPTAVPDEDFEGGENEQERADNRVFSPTTAHMDWCPICLSHFVEQEVAVPESCSHIFCLRCILAWAEKLSSCPIDRKPFSVVYKQDTIKSNTKIPVKQSFSQNSREQKDGSIKGDYHSVTRGEVALNDGLCTCIKEKCERHTAGWQKTEFCEIQNIPIMTCDKKNRSSKKSKNKVNRKTCYQTCVRKDLSSFAPQYGKSEMSHSQAENCTEFVDVYEIAPLIIQKRRGPESLRFLWRAVSSALTTGMLRYGIDVISVEYNEAARAFPLRDLMSGTIFPSSPLALGCSVHFPGKKCALAGTRGGGEKKNTSGASGSTNAGNSETSQGRRRSMRISKAEKLDKSASSPQRPQSSPGTSVPKTSPECARTPPKRAGKQKTKRKLESEQSKIPSDKKKTRVTRSSCKKSSSSSSDPNDSPFVSETESQPQPPLSNEELLTNLDASDSSTNVCGEHITSTEKDNEEAEEEEEDIEKEHDHVENKSPCSVSEEVCVPITDQINSEDSGNSNLPPTTDDENCGSCVERISGNPAEHVDKEIIEKGQDSSKDGFDSLSEAVTCTDVTNSNKDISHTKYPESPSNEDSTEMENKALVDDQNSEQYKEVEFTETTDNPDQVPACENDTGKQSPVESPGKCDESNYPQSKMTLASASSEQFMETESAEIKYNPDEANHTSDCKNDIGRGSSVETPGKFVDDSDQMSEMSLENIKPEQFKEIESLEMLSAEKASDCKSVIGQQYAETPGKFMEDNNLKSEIASENMKPEQCEMGSMEVLSVPEQIPDCKIGIDQQSSVENPGKFMENNTLKSETGSGNIKPEQFEMNLGDVLNKPDQASDCKSGIGQQSSDESRGKVMGDKSLKSEVTSDAPDHIRMTPEALDASVDKRAKSELFIGGTCSSGAEDFNVDNNEVVAMECDSPINDHQMSEAEHKSQTNSKEKEAISSAISFGSNHEVLLPEACVENINKEDKGERPPEIELEKKLEPKEKDVPRRKSRFHAASTTWSPERERKREHKRSKSQSQERSGSQSQERSGSQSQERSGSKSQERSGSQSQERSGSQSQERSGSKSQERSGSQSQERSGSQSQERSGSKSQERSESKSQERSESKSQERSGSRARGRSGSRSRGRSGSRSRGRSGSRSRGRSGSRSRGRSMSKSRGRSMSKSRGRSGSRSRGRSRSRGKSRSQSQGKSRSRSRGRSRSRSWGKDHHFHSDKPEHERNRSKGDDSDRSNQASPSSRKKSRSPSKERDKEELSSETEKREAEADRGKKVRQRSRSRSRSRKRYHSGDKEDKSSFSPGRRDRNMDDCWRNTRGKDRFRMNDRERPRGFDRFRKDRSREFQQTTRYLDEQSTVDTNEYIDDRNPEWLSEQLQTSSDMNMRENEYRNDAKWEENRYERDDHWANRGFGSGWKRGRGRFWGGPFPGDQSEMPWQNRRSNFSGEQNNSGKYQGTGPRRYNDHQPSRWRGESNVSSDVRDRSGWSSFSSWNARKTLPADVQNYYANRGRQTSGAQSIWRGPDEEQYQTSSEQDSSQAVPAFSDQANQQMNGSQQPVNIMHQPVLPQPMNAPPQPMNVFPYPMNVHPPLMHFHNPYIHPPPPLSVHAGISAVQPAAAGNLPNSPPPPPPPPPPSQSVNYAIQQHDMAQPQIIPPPCNVPEVDLQSSASCIPIPASGSGKTVQLPLCIDVSSSTFQSVQQVFASLSTSKPTLEKESFKEEFEIEKPKKDKKGTIQERAVEEVKLAIKPYYQKKDITKDEYKEIVRKAVDKVCHSKSGEVIPGKVANLVKAYVEKYKHARKGNPKQNPEECSIIGNKSF